MNLTSRAEAIRCMADPANLVVRDLLGRVVPEKDASGRQNRAYSRLVNLRKRKAELALQAS